MGLDLGARSSDGWSEEQQLALSITPHITGSLSIIGSAFIIIDVASDRQKWSSTYHRLLFAMGLYDFISSFASSLSTLPMPEESGLRAYGNNATCTVQGMFVHLNIASPLYNFMLSIYFLLTATFRWSKDDIKKKVEIWLHGIPFVFALSTTLVVLTQQGFNDSSLWCWINTTPTGCSNNPDIECERCPFCFSYYRWAFFFIPLWIAAIGTIVVMSMLVASVRKTEKKAAQWRTATVNNNARADARRSMAALESVDATSDSSDKGESHSYNLNAAESGASSNNLRSISMKGSKPSLSRMPSSYMRSRMSSLLHMGRSKAFEEERKRRKRNSMMTRMVAGQAFRYCIVFWITWLPGTANRVLQETLGYSYFWLMLLHVIFTPMQGFLNFFVYIDLRVRKGLRERKRASAKKKKIESLKCQFGDAYDPSVHVVSSDEPDEDSFDENDL